MNTVQQFTAKDAFDNGYLISTEIGEVARLAKNVAVDAGGNPEAQLEIIDALAVLFGWISEKAEAVADEWERVQTRGNVSLLGEGNISPHDIRKSHG